MAERSDVVRFTLDYYDQHAEEFIKRTVDMDVSHVREPFIALVAPGGRILDAGCGSGRDGAEFARRGFDVTAFDGSAELARRAAERTGLPVRHLTFDEVEWEHEFDGVWAAASLLHLARPELEHAMARLARSLKPGGALFVSLKAGTFSGERDGRWFTDVTSDGMRDLLNGVGGLEIVRVWETDDKRPERAGVRWVNALARKS